MKSGLTKVSSRVAQVKAAVELATSQCVMVGVPATTSSRDGPINNAALAYIHDKGAPEANIPARPFMMPGIESVRPELTERLRLVGEAAFEGRVEAVNKGLVAVGLVAAQAIKAKINSNIPPALAPSTLAARRRRGVSRTNTLVDTAAMRNAITFVIRKV